MERTGEARKHLELNLLGDGGGAAPLPPFRSLRWLL
jgi:hypothetical protein